MICISHHISLHALASGKNQTEFRAESTNSNYTLAHTDLYAGTKLHTGDLTVAKVPALTDIRCR